MKPSTDSTILALLCLSSVCLAAEVTTKRQESSEGIQLGPMKRKVTWFRRSPNGSLVTTSVAPNSSSSSSSSNDSKDSPKKKTFVVDENGQWAWPALKAMERAKKAVKARTYNRNVLRGLFPLDDLLLAENIRPPQLAPKSEAAFGAQMKFLFDLLEQGEEHSWSDQERFELFDFARRMESMDSLDLIPGWLLERMAFRLGELMSMAARQLLQHNQRKQKQIDKMTQIIEELRNPGVSQLFYMKSDELRLRYLQIYQVAYREKLEFMATQWPQVINALESVLVDINEILRVEADKAAAQAMTEDFPRIELVPEASEDEFALEQQVICEDCYDGGDTDEEFKDELYQSGDEE